MIPTVLPTSSAAETALEAGADRLSDGSVDADEAYAHALDRFLALGGPDFDGRVGMVGAELGIPERLLALPTGALSGGEAARASLAAYLPIFDAGGVPDGTLVASRIAALSSWLVRNHLTARPVSVARFGTNAFLP